MMATRDRPRQRPDDDPDALAYDALDLGGDVTDEDVEDFLAEADAETEREEKKGGFLNLQTGAGLALISIGTVYLLQQLGFFPLAYSLGTLVSLLPWLAGILIILTGFGVLSWSPARRRRKARRATRERQRRAEKTAGRAAGRAKPRGGPGLNQAWQRAERAFENVSSGRAGKRRLAKGRRNKKIAGVASGIASYLGIDPTLVRIAFVIGAILGNGFTIPLYLILSFVMPQGDDEPDDNDPVVTVLRDR